MRFTEFFAGVGLFRLGLEREGFECVFANDNDPKKNSVYLDNFGPGELVTDDVHDLHPSIVPDAALATASFPCVDLSLAGMRRGLAGGRSGAFYGFAGVLEGMGGRRPGLVLLENVTGLLTCGGGKDIIGALKTLNGIGYAVDMFVMDARWFTPQSRPRLFILGRLGMDAENRDNFEKRDARLKPKSLLRVADSREKIDWSFADIPAPPAKSAIALSAVLEKNGAAPWWDESGARGLLDMMSGRHADLTREAMARGDIVYATAFKRVRNGETRVEPRFDGIAGCLRTPRGGSSRQILLRLGKGEIMARHMTAAEYGRLQGAPADFKLPKSQNAGMFAFGDAVCVPLISWIAGNVLRPILDPARRRLQGVTSGKRGNSHWGPSRNSG